MSVHDRSRVRETHHGIAASVRPTHPTRRGISLMEVLISIFVLSIGMIGIAALIPVGHFSIVETSKADRGSACGQAGMHEVKARQMLNPGLWAYANTTLGAVDVPTDAGSANTFVIDPLFVARNAPSDPSATWFFPYNDSSSMHRITLRNWLGATQVMSEQVADRTFTWSDDLLFERDDDDESQRPRQQMILADGTMAPVTPANVANAVMRQSECRYSWLLSVTPAVSERSLSYDQKRNYTVSVVVFYKRDLSDPSITPTERAVGIEFPGNGYGGGDVKLLAPHTTVTDLEYLNVRPNTWIMVTGITPQNRRVGVWYRVVMVNEELEPDKDKDGNNIWTRYVTLAGPDWDVGAYLPVTMQAILLDGVVGVYTTTVVLDHESTWTK